MFEVRIRIKNLLFKFGFRWIIFHNSLVFSFIKTYIWYHSFKEKYI